MASCTNDNEAVHSGKDIEGKQPPSYTTQLSSCESHSSDRPRQRKPGRVVAGVLLCVAAVFTLRSLERSPISLDPALLLEYPNGAEKSESEFNWLKIKPSEDFVFHPCYDGAQCARLSVPLNWNNPAEYKDTRVAVAIIKYPAKVPVTDPRYAGPILFNPGGPGGSGIHDILKGGRGYQTVVDAHSDPSSSSTEDGDRYYDIIGFDPRGVGATTPSMRCFPDPNASSRWKSSHPSPFLLEASEYVFDQAWSRAIALGAACAGTKDGEPNIIHYTNTPQVVEDMVAIVDRHAKWRQAEAERILVDSRLSAEEKSAIRRRASWIEDEAELLNYWGFSYGTLLGQTFATMHPLRVGRIVLDSVVDAKDYYALGWTTNLQDSDRILVKYSDYCQQSGSVEKCPFYFEGAPPGYLPAYVARAARGFLEEPKVLPPTGDDGPVIFDYTDAMTFLVRSLYEPMAKAEDALAILKYNDAGKAKAIKWKQGGRQASSSPRCMAAGPWSDECLLEQADAPGVWFADPILCSDGPDQANTTKEEFKEYMRLLQGQSDVMGTYWAGIRLGCIGWKGRPAWEFKDTIGAKTANPILFFTNTLDPATPMRNTYVASKLFPGSAILRQTSEGHCSYAMPSIDTGKALRAYFQHGKLPKPDDKPTEPEFAPFVGCMNKVTKCENRSEVDQKLWEAMESLI